MSSATEVRQRFHDILKDFDSAMLVTQTPGGQLRARPMALAQVDENDDVWFMTQSHSGKVDEIRNDSHVCVALQGGNKYLSLSGRANMVLDRAKIDELWNESWKTWFPGGKDDPTLVLLRVTSEAGEYWDNSGSKGIAYLIEAGRAYLSGERPDVDDDPKIHGKTSLRPTAK